MCIHFIESIGAVYGHDRFYLSTVAFGPLHEDYGVLSRMAAASPRGSFQKLGLAAGGLKSALTSLSSTLTSLRTDVGAGGLTERNVKKADLAKLASEVEWNIYDLTGYSGKLFTRKRRYDPRSKSWINEHLIPGAIGVA